MGLLRLPLVLGALFFAAPGLATADTDTGLDLRISAEKAEFAPGEPVRLTFDVTNKNDVACGIATSDAGTVRVISLRRNGKTLRPALAQSSYIDGIRNDIAASLRTAEPGSAVPVAVAGFRAREGDAADSVVLRSVSAMPDGGGLDALWPAGEPGRYELTATYGVPEVGGQRCAGTTTAATVAFTVGEGDAGPPLWMLAGGGGFALLLLGGIVAVLVRRRSGRAAASAVVVLTIACAGVVAGPSPSARAEVIIEPWADGTVAPEDPGGDPIPEYAFERRVKECISEFHAIAAGSSPAAPAVAAVLEHVEGPHTQVRIVPTNGWSQFRGWPESADGQAPRSVIWWHPSSTEPFLGEPGVRNDPCSALYHEFVHAADNAQDTWMSGWCETGVRASEVRATRAENEYRAAKGLDQRTRYGDSKLPADSLDECYEDPEEPRERAGGLCTDSAAQQCGGSYGDPHLMTFDQLDYDFQAVGEFVLTRGDGLEVQARQAPFAGWTPGSVSVNAALAFLVGESQLNLVLDRGDVVVRIDGAEADPERGESALPGGGTLVRQEPASGFGPDNYTVRWPDGSAVQVDTIGTWGLRPVLKMDRGRIGKVVGLLGDFNGDPANDLTPSDGGEPLGPEPEYEPLYRTFGDSWRVRDDTSLFDYGPGESTETFTDRSFPEKQVTVDDLDPAQRAGAERICREAGVTTPVVLAGCVLDVAVTGQPDFAVASADAELVAPPGQSITAPTLASATLDGPDRLTFTGKAGQTVFVDLAAATLPNQCGVVRLLAPDGARLNRGCVINGKGHIERTELSSAGQYTVELASTGQALVRVYEVVDDTGSITPDGRAEGVTLTHPGSVGRLTFTGRTGQTVFVDTAGSSLPATCDVLQVLDPGGKKLNTGCVINGEGYVDATSLPADGRYTVLVDPRDQQVDNIEVRLIVARDQRGPITVNGPPVRATVGQPGAISAFEFLGRAGQRIRVDASERTLPTLCGVIALVGPDGKKVPTRCATAGLEEAALPTDGDYQIVVDPNRRDTGAVALRLIG
jgi:hypothetical protein